MLSGIGIFKFFLSDHLKDVTKGGSRFVFSQSFKVEIYTKSSDFL